jgi:hypothetical protein
MSDEQASIRVTMGFGTLRCHVLQRDRVLSR